LFRLSILIWVCPLPFHIHPDTANKPDERANGNDQVKGDVHEGGHLGDCLVNTGRVQCKRAKNKEGGSRCKNGYFEKELVDCFHV